MYGSARRMKVYALGWKAQVQQVAVNTTERILFSGLPSADWKKKEKKMKKRRMDECAKIVTYCWEFFQEPLGAE